ncbi:MULTISPECIES: hypothetical protein [unclassified Legionella]|uniref:hypothetical protein n=1 Tax=unclassified Legionella TaxID=2622702 RepID=UPI001055DAE6|nr:MULTISPECIES: hypothetical protein [unclassified Legionella]MDI9818229.1 hypothetical protein [Legionella sp. PL877]
MEIGERIADPPRYYSHPYSILTDQELTKEEQIIALKNWRDDINLKLTATAENMCRGTDDASPIAEINELLYSLEKE